MLKLLGIGNLEPRNLDFLELCNERYPGTQWADLTAGQQAKLIRDALTPSQCLIDPTSRYMMKWDVVILVALLYTSVFTPYEVGFLETKFDGLFVVNRCVDVVFVKDMIMQFFLKVRIQNEHGTVWIRERKHIAGLYLKGWFAIDLFSILPFDVLGLALQDPNVQKMKVVRIVRLLRLLKLVRVFRASRIMKRWQDRTGLSFSAQGLLKFGVLLTVISHWMACVWGLLGMLLATDLHCPGDREYDITPTDGGGSWVTSWANDSGSPCYHWHVYLASLHFAVMTITSIGYGDITPTREEEYIIGVFCQLGGGLTWAYVIGSICGIIANANPSRVEFENNMDALNTMLREQDVEYELQLRLREYLRERQYHDRLIRTHEISSEFSPHLQGSLILSTSFGQAIQRISYFAECAPKFMIGLAQEFKPSQYGPREAIEGSGILRIIQRGSVVRDGGILLPGSSWGEDIILSSDVLIDDSPATTMNFVELFSLERDSFDVLTADMPQLRNRIRKAAVKIAFRRAVRLVARYRLSEASGQKPSILPRHRSIHSVFDALQYVEDGLDEEQHFKSKKSRSNSKVSVASDEKLFRSLRELAGTKELPDAADCEMTGAGNTGGSTVAKVCVRSGGAQDSPTAMLTAAGFSQTKDSSEGERPSRQEASKLERRLSGMEKRCSKGFDVVSHRFDAVEKDLVQISNILRSVLPRLTVTGPEELASPSSAARGGSLLCSAPLLQCNKV